MLETVLFPSMMPIIMVTLELCTAKILQTVLLECGLAEECLSFPSGLAHILLLGPVHPPDLRDLVHIQDQYLIHVHLQDEAHVHV